MNGGVDTQIDFQACDGDLPLLDIYLSIKLNTLCKNYIKIESVKQMVVSNF